MDLLVIAGVELQHSLSPGGAAALQSSLLHVSVAVLNNQGGAVYVLGPHLDDVVGILLHSDLLAHLSVAAAGSTLQSEQAVTAVHQLHGVVVPQVFPTGGGANLKVAVGDVAVKGGGGGDHHALAALVQADVVNGGHAAQIHHAEAQLIVLAGADAAGDGLSAGGGEGGGQVFKGQQLRIVQNGHATATRSGNVDGVGNVIVGAGIHVNPLGVTHTLGIGGSGVLQLTGGDGHKALLVAGAGVPIGSVIHVGVSDGIGGAAGGVIGGGGNGLGGLTVVVLDALGGLEQSHTVQPHLGGSAVQSDGGRSHIAGVKSHRANVPIVVVGGGVNLLGLAGRARIGAEILPIEHKLAGIGVDDTDGGITLIVVCQIRTLNKGREGVLGISLQTADAEGVPAVGRSVGIDVQALAAVGSGGIRHHRSVLQERGVVPLTAGGLKAAVLNQVDRIAQGAVLIGTERGQLSVGLLQRRGDIPLTGYVGGGGKGLFERLVGARQIVGGGGDGIAVVIAGDDAVAIAAGGTGGRIGVSTDQVSAVDVGGLGHVGHQALPGVTAVVGTLNGNLGSALGGDEQHLPVAGVGVQHGSIQRDGLATVLRTVLVHVIAQQGHRLTEGGAGGVALQGVSAGVLTGRPAPLETTLIAVGHHPLTEGDQLVGIVGIVGNLVAHVVLGQDGVGVGEQALHALKGVAIGVLVVTHQIQIEITVDGLVAVVGGNSAGHARQFLTSHLVDLLHKVDHILVGNTIHLTAVGGEMIALAQVVDLILRLVGDGDQRHHIGVLGQHLAQRTDELFGIVVSHVGVAQHLGDEVPALNAVVGRHRGGVEIDVPHHRHTDLTAHIQQATSIVQILLLDADDVAVVVKHDTLGEDRSTIGQNVIAHSLQVVNFTINLVCAIVIQLHTVPILSGRGIVFGHQLVTGEVVTGLTLVEPGHPDAVDETIALENLFNKHLIGLAGPREVAAHLSKRTNGCHRHQHQQSRQQGNQLAKIHRDTS